MPTAAGLYYFMHGDNLHDKPPVILVHGAGGTHLSWPPQIRRLSGYQIIALDLPGHGKSEGIGRQDITEYGKAVTAFMQELRLYKAVIVGFSMGAAIALSLSMHTRNRLIGLGLIGSGAKMQIPQDILEMASNPSTFDSAVNTIIETSYSNSTDSQIKKLAINKMSETRQTVLYGDLLACKAFDEGESNMNSINMPTVLISGAEDRMTSLKQAERLRDQIGGAQLHTLKGAGHLVMIEEPDKVADLLTGFLNQIHY